ncbi:MAG: response regulator [Vicinamibacteria bacterium]|nr:response regulator [Vicinamibacteria bacterium]
MKCPKCSAPITATPDAQGYLICSGCGARLRSKASMQAAAAPAPSAPAPTAAPAPPPAAPAAPARAAAAAPTPLAFPAPAERPAGGELAQVLAELRAVRQVQQEILALLRARPTASVPASLPPQAAAGYGGPTGFDASADDLQEPRPPVARSGRRVVLLDDDPITRETATQLLGRQGLEVVATATGKEAINVIAQAKPDAIVLEIGIEGDMPGRDFVNIVKATMDWVDVPLVLFTRVPVADEEEARTIHGADQFVQKGPGAEVVLGQRLAVVLGR